RRILDPAVAARVQALVADADSVFSINPRGRVVWRGAEIATLVAGDTPLKPTLRLLHDDLLENRQRRAIEDRLKFYVDQAIRRRLRPLSLAAKAELPPVLRGIVFQLIEHLGALPRRRLADPLNGLAAEQRTALAALGVRFGRETVWIGGLNDKRQR